MKTIGLKITSAVVIDGAIRKAGAIVLVAEQFAKDLLSRGKAVLATEEDAADGIEVFGDIEVEGELTPAAKPAADAKPNGKKGK